MKNPRASPNPCGSMTVTPAIGAATNFIARTAALSRTGPSRLAALAHDPHEIFAVSALGERLGELEQFIRVDETVAPCDLLHTGDFEPLPLLDDAHEDPGIEQRVVGAGIEPGGSTSQSLDVQRALLEVRSIQIRDFQLASGGWLQRSGESARARVVEIYSGDGIVRRWPARLFQQVRNVSLRIEFDDAISLRILHVIAEHGGACHARGRRLQQLGKVRAVKDVIPE